jgi:hypothetical protein
MDRLWILFGRRLEWQSHARQVSCIRLDYKHFMHRRIEGALVGRSALDPLNISLPLGCMRSRGFGYSEAFNSCLSANPLLSGPCHMGSVHVWQWRFGPGLRPSVRYLIALIWSACYPSGQAETCESPAVNGEYKPDPQKILVKPS